MNLIAFSLPFLGTTGYNSQFNVIYTLGQSLIDPAAQHEREPKNL